MAKMTLLDMTQEILSNLSSDEVNSIGDTTESLQVANIIRQKYRDIQHRIGVPEHNQMFQLTPSNDPLKPTLMYVPDEVSRIDYIKYFNSNDTSGATPGYIYVTVLPNSQFLDLVLSYDLDEIDVESYEFIDDINQYPSTFTFYYKNNAQPTYCTVLSNHYVVFDSYDNTQDSTLQASKTMCSGQITPIFRMEDDFIPDLDDRQFSLLLNEAKALAFYELKQQPHAKAEQEIRRQWSSVQRHKQIDGVPTDFDRLPDFGRRGSYFSRRWWNGPRR